MHSQQYPCRCPFGVLFANLELNEYNATTLRLVAKGTTTERHLRLSSLYFNALTGIDNLVELNTFPNVAAVVNLQAYDLGAAARETVATLQSHATQPYFTISKAGNIVPAVDSAYHVGEIGGNYWDYVLADKLYGVNELLLPTVANATATGYNCRYDPVGNVFEIHDGVNWNAH